MKRREMLTIVGKTAGGLLIAHFVPACKSPFGPDDPPYKDRDILEFMYERILPIVNPSKNDPTGISLYHYELGGKVLKLTKIADNKWTTEGEVRYSGGQYMVCLVDMKVVKVYSMTARKIYARIKGKSDWIELTCIRPQMDGYGEQAEFILDADGIRFPSY